MISINITATPDGIDPINLTTTNWQNLDRGAINQLAGQKGVYFIRERTGQPEEVQTVRSLLNSPILYIGHGGKEGIKKRLRKHFNNSQGKGNNSITNNWYTFFVGDNHPNNEGKQTDKERNDAKRKVIEGVKPKKELQFAYIQTDDEFSSLMLETYYIKAFIQKGNPPRCNA